MLDISKKKLYYWSPGFVHIATFKAVINSFLGASTKSGIAFITFKLAVSINLYYKNN